MDARPLLDPAFAPRQFSCSSPLHKIYHPNLRSVSRKTGGSMAHHPEQA